MPRLAALRVGVVALDARPMPVVADPVPGQRQDLVQLVSRGVRGYECEGDGDAETWDGLDVR